MGSRDVEVNVIVGATLQQSLDVLQAQKRPAVETHAAVGVHQNADFCGRTPPAVAQIPIDDPPALLDRSLYVLKSVNAYQGRSSTVRFSFSCHYCLLKLLAAEVRI